MPLGVEQDIVRLDVSVNDVLGMDIAEGAAQFSNPETDSLLGKRLSGDVESQVAAAHQIDDEIPGEYAVSIGFHQTGRCNLSWEGGSHVFDILEAVPQVTDEGVVNVLQHSSLADDVSDALGLDNC